MSPEHVFSRTIGEETFLAYPNGEASRLAEALQAPESPTAKTCAHLKEARTCSLRHPAFITFMRAAGRNGLLREEGRVADLPAPADLSEAEAALFEELNLPAALKQAGEEAPDTAPQTFLAEHLKKHLTLPPGRADRVIIRVEVKGQTVTGPIEGIATLTREGTVETSAMADTVARPMAVIGPYLRAENIPPGVHTPLSLPAPAGDPRRVLAETGYKFSRDFKSVTFREVTSAL